MPKVSVIVPVYNVEKYLRKCLDSLVNQTLKDIEIILVNDGSTDNSKEIMMEYSKKYNNIKYFEKENGGLSDARNYGMKYVSSSYVACLDSDDYVEKDLYEKLYNKAVSEDFDMVECDFIWEYDNKKKIDNGIEYKNKEEMVAFGRVVAWNKLIKTDVINKAKVEYPFGLRYEDIEFYYKMIPYYNKVSIVKEPLIHYVQRGSSISKVQNEKTKDIFQIIKNVLDFYKEKDIYEKYYSELEYAFVRILFCSSLFRIVKVQDKEIRNKLINQTWNFVNDNFRNWKKNEILKQNKSLKNMYLKSINKRSFKLYSKIFRIIK